ncbi:TPA: hypothetical protein N2930_004470 [Vibrio parahaemolyticus]|nr:hypothetical protein [Vibrio parahaemolyticus]
MIKYGLLRLMFYKPEIKKKLIIYRNYIDKMEEMVNLEVAEMERLHEESPPDAYDYETDELVKFRKKEWYELKHFFPTIQSKSEIITSYALFEFELNKICEIYESCISHTVKIKDLKSNGFIDGSKRYLEKIVGAKFPVDGEYWIQIQRIQEIRNLLVHADGAVNTGNKGLMGYIKGSDYLNIDGNGKISIKPGYSSHIITVMIGFFEELFLSLEDTNITRYVEENQRKQSDFMDTSAK